MGYSKIGIEVLNIEALKRNGDVKSLVKALDHRSRLVRESAADALSEIGSELLAEDSKTIEAVRAARDDR